MKIILLDSTTEPIFWRYVEDRIEEYFFFIMDLKNYPEFTKIWMAIDDAGKIHGMLLNFKEKHIQIRGNNEAVKILLNEIDMKSMEITILKSQKELLDSNITVNKEEILLNRMVIHPGENVMKNKFIPEILNESDREEIASLSRKTDPVFWGHVQGKDLEFSKSHKWFGIRRENKIVSFAQTWIGDEVSIISIVATDPDFQNRGFATSLVASSIQELFKHSPLGLIHVRAENTPVVHTYKKNGFKDYFIFSFFKNKNL